jgi:branched-chain amino acid transport system substrate-binding protein
MATDEIRIGVLAALLGPFKALGEEGVRGVELAVSEFDGKIGEKRITLFVETTSAVPDVAYSKAVILLARDSVDFIIGPLSGNEGLAVRNLAKTRPERVFINGSAGAQELTLPNGAPNFYTFSMNGAQWMAGVGSYAAQQMGFKKMITIGEDYSFPYAQVGSFILEFCREGGQILNRFWVPLGTSDYSSYIDTMPTDIDAVFVALGGSDAVTFINQYQATRRKTPIIGGPIALDQIVLNTIDNLPDSYIGTISGGPVADDIATPEWETFVTSYTTKFPYGFRAPSLTMYAYYINTKAALLGLSQIEGDLSNNQSRFKTALDNLEFESPTGPVKLDQHRHAIANTFVTAIDKNSDGKLYIKRVQTNTAVNQTLGLPEADYLRIGPFGRDNPPCG